MAKNEGTDCSIRHCYAAIVDSEFIVLSQYTDSYNSKHTVKFYDKLIDVLKYTNTKLYRYAYRMY